MTVKVQRACVWRAVFCPPRPALSETRCVLSCGPFAQPTGALSQAALVLKKVSPRSQVDQAMKVIRDRSIAAVVRPGTLAMAVRAIGGMACYASLQISVVPDAPSGASRRVTCSLIRNRFIKSVAPLSSGPLRRWRYVVDGCYD